MNVKKAIRVFSITLLLGAVILAIPSTNWEDPRSLGSFAGLSLATIGSIISIFIPSSYVRKFSLNDWMKKDSEYIIHIKGATHGIGKNPNVEVYKKLKTKYVLVEVECIVDQKGNVTLEANSKFNGKMKIS